MYVFADASVFAGAESNKKTKLGFQFKGGPAIGIDKGGRVYFGISNGKIVGQDVFDQTLKSIFENEQNTYEQKIC